MGKQFYVYIVTHKPRGVLYVGVTSDLVKRIYQHKEAYTPGFTEKYYCGCLVYFECHEDAEQAILREKRLKKWNRDWKIRLIEERNPEWSDLYPLILGEGNKEIPAYAGMTS